MTAWTASGRRGAGRGVARLVAACLAGLFAGVLFAFAPLSPAGAETLQEVARSSEEGIEARIFRGVSGFLVDVGNIDAVTGLAARFEVQGEDVTERAESTRPLSELVLLLGGDSAFQCESRLRINALLAPPGDPALPVALAGQENTLCSELAIERAPPVWTQAVATVTGYRRILVVEAGEGPAAFAEAHPYEWARLKLAAAVVEDPRRLVEALAAFLEAASSGFLSFIPTAEGESSLTIVYLRDGTEWHRLEAREGVWQATLRRIETGVQALLLADPKITLVVAAGIVVLLFALVIWRVARRWRNTKRRQRGAGEKPVRAVRIGFGKDFDYSLGASAKSEAVARLELYSDGRRRLVRLDATAAIDLDGESIDEAAWISDISALTIAGKKIVVV